MASFWMLVVILFPIACGCGILFLPEKNRRLFLGLSAGAVFVTAVAAWVLILNPPSESLTVFKFWDDLVIEFRIDGLSRIFMGLISGLWPLSVIYAFEYMAHEANPGTLKERTFFGVYTLTYGVTLGISMAGNLLTMYVFYEMLTLVTIPLVLFTLTRAAIQATRTYMVFSLGGAAFGFISLIFLMAYGNASDFTLGGILDPAALGGRDNILRFVYIMGFMGFGVKAAVFPLNSWLPKASVAPTPVTALLHAVAVVKSGAFAIIRLTYYCYGADFIKGTFAQYIPMGIALFTIIYGCAMAMKERHFKRRLAYSTTSNLSYVLFAAMILSPLGLKAALSFMIFHGVMKITAFFCAGAFLTKGSRVYVYELNGLYREMPVTTTIFTISALAIMGLPGLPGFAGKWLIAGAAVADGGLMPVIGVGVLIVSSMLTAVYMLQPVTRIYFHENKGGLKEAADPGICMILPLVLLTVAMIIFGLFFTPLTDFIGKVAQGVI